MAWPSCGKRTPAYLAPERLLHDAVEPASDVYALGVLLYRLLAGHSPWTSETTTQMLTAHIYLDPTPLLPMFQIPPCVTDLCNRCLAKDPAERPSAREAAALLAHSAGLEVITDEPPAQQQTAIDSEPSVLIRPAGSVIPATIDQEPAQPQTDAPGSTAADGGTAPSKPPDEESAAAPSEPDGQNSVPAGSRRNHAALVLTAVVLPAAVAATLWILRPAHPTVTVSASPPTATGFAPLRAASPAAVTPGTSAAPATAGPGSISHNPAATISADPALGPTAAGIATAPTPATTAPTTNAPGPTVTTTAPATEPSERTLSSSAGSVRATCPATDTAQILSWTPTKPYKFTAGDQDAGPAPTVTFQHGTTHVTMTVTCDDSVPSATT